MLYSGSNKGAAKNAMGKYTKALLTFSDGKWRTVAEVQSENPMATRHLIFYLYTIGCLRTSRKKCTIHNCLKQSYKITAEGRSKIPVDIYGDVDTLLLSAIHFTVNCHARAKIIMARFLWRKRKGEHYEKETRNPRPR